MHGFRSWSDWLKQQDTNFGRELMFRNLDETAVSHARPGAVGMVVSKRMVARRGPVTLENAHAWAGRSVDLLSRNLIAKATGGDRTLEAKIWPLFRTTNLALGPA